MKRFPARKFLPSSLALCAAMDTAPALAQLEEVIVTAQRRAESVQEVPIAVSVFDADALAARQIESFADLQFNAPNVSYTKGNFSSNNFQIRGVGNPLVAASADSGVGIHINDVPVIDARLYETEYYDVEQLMLLRGPQGTLFGRNATGGVVNMVTRKPGDEFGGELELQAGDYDYVNAKGAVNVPITDQLAARFAGIYLEREGYTENLLPGFDDVDGRDQYSLRGSLRWTPAERTTVDLMLSWFDEDSNRSRGQKMLCHHDPSALLGCLPDKLDNGVPNSSAQLSNLLASDAVLGPFGLFPFLTTNDERTPSNLRKVETSFEPQYEADENLVTLQFEHEFQRHTLTTVAGYQDTEVSSRQSYLWGEGREVSVPASVAAVLPVNYAAYFADGLLPTSDASASGTGLVGGHIQFYSDTLSSNDLAYQATDQQSLELRLASEYEGAVNFLVGGFWLEADMENDYHVFANGLDYVSLVAPVSARLDGVGWVAPYFHSETDRYGLESYAAFGEIYYDIAADLKLTLGGRFTVDQKDIRDRQLLFNTDANGNRIYQAIGDDTPLPVPYRNQQEQWEESTGRVVLDWLPETDFTDSTLVYASFSRGYKGGGFNPPFDPVLFPSAQPTFDPEFVDAWEVGTKNTLLDNRLQANLSAFFYDYEGMQVSKIINRTSFNENTDSEIMGAEAEFLFAPTDNWRFNAMVSWLHTEIKGLRSVDTRDPTGGRSDVTLIKDFPFAYNCVIQHNGGPDPLAAGVIDSQFQDCEGLAATFAADDFPYPYIVTDGIAADLDGNELQLTPEWSLALGAQYDIALPQALRLELRLDYYWQDEMWGRNYNRDPIDRIDSWDVWNAQAVLRPGSERWFVKAWVQNIQDEDNVTGMFVSDATSGLFTNVFTIAPRTIGVGLGYNF